VGSRRGLHVAMGGKASNTILMLASRPHISGPIPKIVPLQIAMFEAYGYSVYIAYWGSRSDGESMARKLLAGPVDLLRALRSLSAGSHRILFVNTSHDAKTLLRDVPLLWCTRRRHVHKVLLLHGSQADRLVQPGSLLLKRASRFMARHADAILLLSRSEQDTWERFEPRGRYFNVLNPFVPSAELVEAAVEHDRMVGKKCGQREILFVGRLIRKKGVVELLEAMELVNEKLSCRLVLAGEGPLRDHLRSLVRDKGLSAQVDFLGYLDAAGLAKAYAAADALVLPTWSEGFPTVIAEAMSVGLPIITTRIRGAADLLTEGENCLFVPPRDPASLAKSILAILEDHELAQRMSAANEVLVKRFQPAVVGAAYARALEVPIDADE
jgi:glycosyltransferase involved in cell wall biosynthesis